MKGYKILAPIGAIVFASTALGQIALGQTDTFEDGFTANWNGSPFAPYQPTNISTGGPLGVGDHYLRVQSNGASQSGGKLAMYNSFQWAGNYSAAGVRVVEMDIKNFGSTALLMRPTMFGIEGTRYTSSNAFSYSLPINSGWRHATFFLTSEAMVQVYLDELFPDVARNNQQLLFRHQAGNPDPYGTSVVAHVGFDNIHASDHVTIVPTSVTTLDGFDFAGELRSLFSSDDDRFSILSDDVTLQGSIQVDGTSPVSSVAELHFEIESQAGRPGLAMSVAMRNYVVGGFSEVGGGVAPISDTNLQIVLTSPSRFIQTTTRAMQSKVTWSPINDEDPSQDGWLLSLDLARWQVYPNP